MKPSNSNSVVVRVLRDLPQTVCYWQSLSIRVTESCSFKVLISADQSRLLKMAEEVEDFVAARAPSNAAKNSLGLGTTSPPCLLLSLVIATIVLVGLRQTLAKWRGWDRVL